METDSSVLKKWAQRMPEMGPAVYKLTDGPKEHKHTYHIFCPWSPDGSKLLVARYDRVNPDAEVCLMDTASAEVRPVGVTRRWNSHDVAYQQWVGKQNRLLYRSGGKEASEFVTVDPDGSDERIYTGKDFVAQYCSLDGKYVYGVTPLHVLCPDNNIEPRHDKGVMRYNLETGDQELVLSIEDALALLPDAETYEKCHLYAKMLIIHPRSGRILFNLTNTFWDRDGTEPRVRCLITMDPDGSNPAYLGRVAHHPNWHTLEDRVIGNVKDFNDKLRFGFYRGDGSGLLDYVPETTGSGHPSLSPDGTWICTDAKSGENFDNSVILCDPVSGEEIWVAAFNAVSDGYPSFKAIDQRGEGETVMSAILKSREARKAWQTQCHPAWSRDGSAIIFNRDAGDGEGSQLYMVDVHASLHNAQ